MSGRFFHPHTVRSSKLSSPVAGSLWLLKFVLFRTTWQEQLLPKTFLGMQLSHASSYCLVLCFTYFTRRVRLLLSPFVQALMSHLQSSKKMACVASSESAAKKPKKIVFQHTRNKERSWLLFDSEVTAGVYTLQDASQRVYTERLETGCVDLSGMSTHPS